MSDQKKVFGSSTPGIKYEGVYENIGVDYILIGNRELLFNLLGKNKVQIYHLRYLGLKNFKSYILLFFIPILLKLRGVKFIWTMHNYLDHYSNQKFFNVILNYWVLLFADHCIVFHESMKEKFSFFHDKIHVTNFWGVGYREELRECDSDVESIENVKEKLKESDFKSVIVSISTAKKNLAYSASDFLKNSNSLMIFVDPRGDFDLKINKNKNVLYLKTYVGMKFWEFISKLDNTMGILGHYNYSVATSLFTFAEFQMPMLCYDILPNNKIIESNKLGNTYSTEESFKNALTDLQLNYSSYKNNCRDFITNYSNDHNLELHHKLFNG